MLRSSRGSLPARGGQDHGAHTGAGEMSYLRAEPLDETNFPLFEAIKNQFGFIPNFYRAQTMRPDLIEAEAQLVNAILIREGALSHKEKEYVFLVCSAANLSTYCELRIARSSACSAFKVPSRSELPSTMRLPIYPCR